MLQNQQQQGQQNQQQGGHPLQHSHLPSQQQNTQHIPYQSQQNSNSTASFDQQYMKELQIQQQQHQQQQRYHYLQQQQQKIQQQQQQQQSPPQPQPYQQYANPMMALSHQNTISNWNPQSLPMTQPSESSLQRLGLTRRVSSHMQRLPSISNVSISSPLSSQMSMSPNASTTFSVNSDSSLGPSSPNMNSNFNQNKFQNTYSNGSSPEKSSLFKNYWGFNNDQDNQPSSNNSSQNSINTTTTPNILPPTYTGGNNPARMHSISEFSHYANHNTASPSISNKSSSMIRPPNLHLSSFSDHNNMSFANQISPHNTTFNNAARNKSFAMQKQKFNVNLPTTPELAQPPPPPPPPPQPPQQNIQQPSQLYQQQPYNQGSFRDNGPQSQIQQNQQQQQHPRSYSMAPPMNDIQKTQRLSRYEMNRSNNHSNLSSRTLLESQQQQIIPPLRADGPVLPSNINTTGYSNVNTNVHPSLRRESVAGVYHQNLGNIPYNMNGYIPINAQYNYANNTNNNTNNTFQTTPIVFDNKNNNNNNGNVPYANFASIDEVRAYYNANDLYNQHNIDENLNMTNQSQVSKDEVMTDQNALHDEMIEDCYSKDPDNDIKMSNSNNSTNEIILPQRPSSSSPSIYNTNNYTYVTVPTFQKVESIDDLHPVINEKPKYRRASSTHSFVSPLAALTTRLNVSYSMCVPEYDYQKSKNPRRVLTKNNKPVHNGGYDNESYDYILYVNDILGTEENKKYLVLDILGQGTFGQVVKCQNLKTQEIVAVKVIKARQECLQQSIAEGNVVEYLNKKIDPKYKKYFINLKDKFMHKFHLCLVFELLSSNLYELIKQNHHHGLSIKLVRNFATQILDALCALKEIKIIHCDLKPENILLSRLNKPDLKIIDFGSACEEHQTLYSYVQSRFYRSPEVILGVGYSTSVDMWSFGCIVAELFLGLPLLPGASEYEQLARMIETFGMPPSWMLVEEKASNYVVKYTDIHTNKCEYRLKTLDEFNRDFGLHEEPAKQYFCDTKLDDIILKYRLPKKNMTKEMIDKEMHLRNCLVHFLKGVLNISPLKRWTPHEAMQHPFITGEPWTGQWTPPTANFSTFTKDTTSVRSLV